MATVRLERELAGTKRTSRYVFACAATTRSYTRLDALTGVLETGGRHHHHQNHRLCSATGAALRLGDRSLVRVRIGVSIIRLGGSLSLRPIVDLLRRLFYQRLPRIRIHAPRGVPRGQTDRESLSVTKCNVALINVTASVVGGLGHIGKEDCLPIGNRSRETL